MMGIKKWFLLALSLGSCFSAVQAILDGRITPITLDAVYTFSNYEWARGTVNFNAGFIIPKSTTAILGIDVPLQTQIYLSNLAANASEMSTIILEKPLLLKPILGGSILGGCVFKTLNGYEGLVTGFSDVGDRFTIDGNVTIDMTNLWGYIYPHSTNGPNLLPQFVLDGTTASTLRLKNGNLVTTATVFHGEDTAGRHQLILENMNLFLSTATNMTFSNMDLVIDNGKTKFYAGSYSSIDIYGALKIKDYGILQAGALVDFNLKSSEISGNDYFDISPRGKLLLTSNTLKFSRPLYLPYSLPEENTYSKIAVDGLCRLQATGTGTNAIVQLGSDSHLTYTYDGLIELSPFSTLQLDNVQLINKNFIL